MAFKGIRKNYRNIRRFQEITGILIKHGFGFLVRRESAKEKISSRNLARKIRGVLEELGPTFVKFGQILSVRPDVLPPVFIAELKKLQDEVPPVEFEKVEEIIQEEFNRNTAGLFESFERTPVASASISQVHLARLKTGERVAVKVQRPGIESIISNDLDILHYLARLIEGRFPEMFFSSPVDIVKEFSKTIRKELDFAREARNIEVFRENFLEVETVYVPRVFWDFTTDKVLTISEVEGIKVSDFSKIEKAGLDRRQIAKNGANAVLKQIFIDGFFHGDPHPGNVYVLEGNIICFLDFGIVGRLSDERKKQFSQMLFAILRKDTDKLFRILSDIGIINENVPAAEVKQDIAELIDSYYNVPLKYFEFKKVMKDIHEIAYRWRIKIPSEFALLGKVLVTIEGIGMGLDPNFDMVTQAKPFMKNMIRAEFSAAHILRNLSEFAAKFWQFAMVFPEDAGEIMKKLRLGKIKIQIEHKGLNDLISTLEKVSNRIVIGLVAAALIIGSSLLIRTNELGVAGFLFAGILGVWLILSSRFRKK